MFCQKCGRKLEDDAKFCTGCGSKFELKETYAQPQPQQQAQPQFQSVQPSVPVMQNQQTAVKEKKKGGKKPLVIVIVILLVLAIAGGVAAFLLSGGDKTGEAAAGEGSSQQEDEVVPEINEDFVLYAKQNSLYIAYTEKNQSLLLTDSIYYDGEDYITRYFIPEVTYYNEKTGYLYFPHEIGKVDYADVFKLSRIKVDSENIVRDSIEVVVDEWINRYSGYSVVDDDSLIVYKTFENDLWYKKLDTDEAAKNIDYDVNGVEIDFEKNNCYYNDDTNVYYLNLETMEKNIVFTVVEGVDYFYVSYVGDSAFVNVNADSYLVDKDGNQKQLPGSGHFEKVGDNYYYIDYSADHYDYLPASLFVTDDWLETDAQIGYGDTGYNEKRIRDEIRRIVAVDELSGGSSDDIYIVEGNDVRLVISDVYSCSNDGTEATSCFKLKAPEKIITVSEIYDYIVDNYDVQSVDDIEDYYVGMAVQSVYDYHYSQYIIVNGVANEINAEEINYIGTDVYYTDDYVYFYMSTGRYYDYEYEYEVDNPAKLYRAPINSDSTLGEYELYSDAGYVTSFSEENVFSARDVEYTDEGTLVWYVGFGELYRNDEFIDSDVAIVYAENYGDDFNKYYDNKALYVKNIKETDTMFRADVYYYDGADSECIVSYAADYEFSTGGTIYCIYNSGTLVRYGADGDEDVSYDVDFVFVPEKTTEWDTIN